MVRRNNILLVVLLLSLVFSTSCSFFRPNTVSQEAKQRIKLEAAAKQVNDSNGEKIEIISRFAAGTDYALNKSTNTEPSVEVAKELNLRVISLSGEPQINAKKEIWSLVDKLTSDLITERVEGRKLLNKEDKDVQDIQTLVDKRVAIEKAEMEKYKSVAKSTAQKNEASQAELGEYKGWLGLKAVWKGLVQFAFSSIWIIAGVMVVFLIIRGFAKSNPIAAAILGIFEEIVSWVVVGVRGLFPKAIALAGHVPQKDYNRSSGILFKLVDSIQWVKLMEKKTEKDVTVKELLSHLDSSLDKSEKDEIDRIKSLLGY